MTGRGANGRRINSNWRPRDTEGWIIPTPGTTSRKCYDLMKAGSTTHTIARLTGMTIQAVYRIRCRIKNPEKFKIWHRDQMSRRKLTGPANVTP